MDKKALEYLEDRSVVDKAISEIVATTLGPDIRGRDLVTARRILYEILPTCQAINYAFMAQGRVGRIHGEWEMAQFAVSDAKQTLRRIFPEYHMRHAYSTEPNLKLDHEF